jgi:hypothetical protein
MGKWAMAAAYFRPSSSTHGSVSGRAGEVRAFAARLWPPARVISRASRTRNPAMRAPA